MKKISDEKLDNMLKDIYNSKVDSFEFKSNYISSEEKFTPEITVSGAESCKKHSFRPSKMVAIAAAAILAVGVGIYSLPPVDTFQPATIMEETENLFEKYLEEFTYETENFNYSSVKVSANPQNEFEVSQNILYADLCSTMQLVPAYENCTFKECFDGSTSLQVETDENFYFYLKCIPKSDGSHYYTRQAYLVWKDENDNITKIIPSSEKIDTNKEFPAISQSLIDSASTYCNSLMEQFSDSTKPVYLDDILIRPEMTTETDKEYCYSEYDYLSYMNIDGVETPVSVSSTHYWTFAQMNHENPDFVTERLKEIPMLRCWINEDYYTYDKIFYHDLSSGEPVDISTKVEEMNNNYWLEPAVNTETEKEETLQTEFVSEETTQEIITTENVIEEFEVVQQVPEGITNIPPFEITEEIVTTSETIDISSFEFNDLATMYLNNDEAGIEKWIEIFGSDALQRTENGFAICSYCLMQNGFNLDDVNIYGDTNLNLNILEFYKSLGDIEKMCVGFRFKEAEEGGGNEIAALEVQNPAYDYINYQVSIYAEDYKIVVHYPNNQVLYSKEEKERMVESFHNTPWAEIIIEK